MDNANNLAVSNLPKKKKMPKLLMLFFIIISVFAAYFLLLLALFLFEPAEINELYFEDIGYSYIFDEYKKFSKENSDTLYIKQISAEDIVFTDFDSRLRYCKDVAIAVAGDNTSYSDAEKAVNDLGGEICGYIEMANFYQIEFDDLTFTELYDICTSLSQSDEFLIAIPDYFDESQVGTSYEETTDSYAGYDLNYCEQMNIEEAWKYLDYIREDVKVGIIDDPIPHNIDDLNLINASDYSDSYVESNYYYSSHSAFVGGLIGASGKHEVKGVYPGVRICSENGLNITLSYWLAAYCDMIINDGVKAINVSMGYYPYISVSASLGDENAIAYITKYNTVFAGAMDNLIDNGYEFVICFAAGNDGETVLVRTVGEYFGYGNKYTLQEFDIFRIFSEKPDYVDSKYGFNLSLTDDFPAVTDRIIYVGSHNGHMISSFSNTGERVDILAPGEFVMSLDYKKQSDLSFATQTTCSSGTSFAAPFVTGTAAFIFAVDPTLTGAQVKDIIIGSASQTISNSQFEYPILDIAAAVEYAYTNR